MIDLEKIYDGSSLSTTETESVFAEMFAGKLDPVLCSSLLTAMKMNGYTASEIGGAASAMLNAAVHFERDLSIDTGDIVGTGGDCLSTINISTLAAIVCAELGLHIAKHGNTAVSSKTGASDLLQQLGYDIRCPQELSRKNLEENGFAFIFAQVYHPGMRFIAPIRKKLSTSTIFNLLGPLCNPCRINYQILGCYDPTQLVTMVKALKIAGVDRAVAVNGNGMDEISIFGQTDYAELFADGHIEQGVLTARDFGITASYTQDDLRGGTPEENAHIAIDVLSGQGADAHNAVVAANAAGLLRLAGRVKSYKEGFELAMETIRSGKCTARFDLLCRVSRGQGA